MRKKTLLIIIGIVLVALISVGVYFGINYFKKDPKQVFNTIVNVGSDKIKEFIKSDNNFMLDLFEKEDNLGINLKGDVKIKYTDLRYYITDPNTNFDISTDYDFNLNINKLAKKMQSDFKIGLNNEEVIDGSAIVSNNTFYAKLKDFSKYYYIDQYVDFDALFNYSKKDISKDLIKLITYLQQSINEAVTKDDIISEKANISIDNNNIDVTKYSVHIDNNLVNKIGNIFRDKVKSDEELVNDLGVDVDYKSNVVDDNSNIDANFSYYITNDSKLVLMELSSLNNDSSNNIKIRNYNNLFKIEYVTSYKLYPKCEGCEPTTITSNIVLEVKKDNNNYDFKLTSDDEKIVEGNISIENDKIGYKLVINSIDNELNISGYNKTKKESNSVNYDGNIKVIVSGDDQKFEFEANYNATYGKTNVIDDSAIFNAENIDYISLEDQEVADKVVEKINEIISKYYKPIDYDLDI